MSSVYIKGMQMPKNYPICIVIDASGQARKYDLVNDKYADDEVFEANNIPDHGRLIDADPAREAIIKAWQDSTDNSFEYKRGMEDACEVIRCATTIIPADKEADNG